MPQVSPRLSSSPHPAFHLSSQTMSKVMDSEVNATLGKLKPSGTVKPTMGRGPRRSAPGLGSPWGSPLHCPEVWGTAGALHLSAHARHRAWDTSLLKMQASTEVSSGCSVISIQYEK